MVGIVLSGGGSKGAYEIGVWKALRKLRIKYDLVTGTSVGALNAALMCQNNYYKALHFWKKLTFEDVIDKKINSKEKKEIYKTYFKGAIKGGMTINNLEKTVDKAIDTKKIYKSKINIGIITFNIKTLKPLKLIKRGIPKNKFKDYLVASASCFPAFTKKIIDDNAFIDGGIYDNLPINLAIQMGADEIIAVDLKEIGIKQKVKNKDIPITYISPRNDIGSFLIFDSDSAKRAIRLGYNDTLKIYHKLEGDKYSFKDLKRNYDKYYFQLYSKIDSDLKKLFKKDSYKSYLNLLEELGEIFEIDDSYIYRVKKFDKLIKKKLSLVPLKDKPKKDTKEIIKYLCNNLDDRKYQEQHKKEYLYALYIMR